MVKKENIYKIIGRNIKLFRKKERMTLHALSRKAGISPSFLSNIESGSKQPTLLTLEKIASSLKINITALFTRREKSALSSSDDTAVTLDMIKLFSEKTLEDKKKILHILKYL